MQKSLGFCGIINEGCGHAGTLLHYCCPEVGIALGFPKARLSSLIAATVSWVMQYFPNASLEKQRKDSHWFQYILRQAC